MSAIDLQGQGQIRDWMVSRLDHMQMDDDVIDIALDSLV